MSNSARWRDHVTVEDYPSSAAWRAVHQFCRIGQMSIIGGLLQGGAGCAAVYGGGRNPAETRTINKVGMEKPTAFRKRKSGCARPTSF